MNREEHSTGSGIFQSFTSYLQSYAADDPPEPSEEELNDTLCTVDCIGACPMNQIHANILNIPQEPLGALIDALLGQLPQDVSPVVAVVKPEPGLPNHTKSTSRQSYTNPGYNPTVVYILEVATMIVVGNSNATAFQRKEVAEALHDIIRDATNVHPLIVARATFYLLVLLHTSHDHAILRAPLILHAISSLGQPTIDKAALPITKGLMLCLQGARPLRNEIINTPDFWLLMRTMQKIREASAGVFGLISGIMEDTPSAVTADNYEAAVLLLNDFATAGSVGSVVEQRRDQNARKSKPSMKPTNAKDTELVGRGKKAVEMIFHLSSRVPSLIAQSHLERTEAWTTYWSPIFRVLTTQCVNPCREIRHQAFSSLQRALLSPQLASPDHQEWTAIFGEVLFPLILQLLKPEVYHTDPSGMSDTRVQAATLLCKIFLHYLVLLSEWGGMLELWLKILDIMDRLMNSGQGDSLEEAVPESLKNILLVMANGGYLVSPKENPEKAALWNETWKRTERFLPGMFNELFPDTESVTSPEQSEPIQGRTDGQAGNVS